MNINLLFFLILSMLELFSVLINGELNEVIRADKSVIFMFGHWMGKADISWMADGRRVF